jgi:hypothetical protein
MPPDTAEASSVFNAASFDSVRQPLPSQSYGSGSRISSPLFLLTFLSTWLTASPFPDLSDPKLLETRDCPGRQLHRPDAHRLDDFLPGCICVRYESAHFAKGSHTTAGTTLLWLAVFGSLFTTRRACGAGSSSPSSSSFRRPHSSFCRMDECNSAGFWFWGRLSFLGFAMLACCSCLSFALKIYWAT